MRQAIVEAFRYCSEVEKRGTATVSDPSARAIATSIDRYLRNLFDQLAIRGKDGRREVADDRMISICDHLDLPRPSRDRPGYDEQEFCSFMIKAMTPTSDDKRGMDSGKCRLHRVTLDEIAESMIRKDECQWRMLEAVNKRAMAFRATKNERPSILETVTKRSAMADWVNKRLSITKSESLKSISKSMSKSISGDSVPMELREVQIENLIREVIQKQAKIEALERFSLALCEKLVDLDSANLASKIARSCDSKEKRAKRNRTSTKSRNRSVDRNGSRNRLIGQNRPIDRNRSKSRSVLEEANKALNEKLDRIAGELTGVKSILTLVQPDVEKLERKAAEKPGEVTEAERKDSAGSNDFPQEKSICESASPCLHQAAMCDSVSDSGCMSDEDMGEEMTNSQESESAVGVEAIVLSCLRQCVEATAAKATSTGIVQSGGMAMAKNMRQRLQEVSKRLRDTETRLAQLTRVPSVKRGEPDGQTKVLTTSCSW